MKCDELKSINCVDSDLQEFCEPRLMYPKSDVDAAIAELKDENDRLECDLKTARMHRENAKIAMHETEEHALQLHNELRATKRALYKACANWARSERYTEATWHGDEHREELWANVQAKCLKKAEEYK